MVLQKCYNFILKFLANRFHCVKNASVNLLDKTERITVEELNQLRASQQPHLLIDVRTNPEYEMCHLSNSLNIHINSLEKNTNCVLETVEKLKQFGDDPKSKGT